MSEQCKWIYVPISITDWGSIEAWLNKKAQKGWRFVEERWMFFAKMSYQPSAPNVVYRLKQSNADSATIKLRKEHGWHSEYTSLGVGCELWWKETDDLLEYCPDEFSHGQESTKSLRWDYLSEIVFAILLMINSERLSRLPDGLFYSVFNDFFCGLLLLIHMFLQWRNLRNSEYIGWPSIILTSIIGKLFVVVLIGSFISDWILL